MKNRKFKKKRIKHMEYLNKIKKRNNEMKIEEDRKYEEYCKDKVH